MAVRKSTGSKRRQATVYIREDQLHEVRGCVLALGSEGLEPSNLSRFHDGAVERELKRLRAKHNRGKPFRPYKTRLPGGRPTGS